MSSISDVSLGFVFTICGNARGSLHLIHGTDKRQGIVNLILVIRSDKDEAKTGSCVAEKLGRYSS
jgi:hypothetical protein